MSFQSILEEHLNRYPRLHLVDIYKLVQQASLGSEHAVSDFERARSWLEREVSRLGAGPEEPVEDPISPGGGILRIHLRPYLGQGGEVQQLLRAFVRTANEFQGSVDRLKEFWQAVDFLATEGRLAIPVSEVRAFWSTMKARNFPAVHHSPTYQKIYRPAYRVVARQFFETERS